MATFETEIRKLQPVELGTLARYLNESNYWKKLMEVVPKEDDENTSMFSHDHFRMIEQAIDPQKNSGAEIFLSEWSTLNRRRPTCKLLLDLLVKIEFFKAADYLAVDVLKIDPPERPKHGPGAPVDISEKMLEKLLREQAGIETESESDFSVHYVEKPAEAIPMYAEKPSQPQVELSDLMKFSDIQSKSDMIKFSQTQVADDLKKLPERVSSMKVDVDNVADVSEYQSQLETYGLQVVQSENIPRCVNDDDIYSNDHQTETLSTATQSTISSSSYSDSSSTQPTASESDIPIAVLKYSDKSSENNNS